MTALTRREATPIDWLFAPEWLDLETACFLSGWTQGEMLRIIEENGVDLNTAGMIEKQSLEEFNEAAAELLHWDERNAIAIIAHFWQTVCIPSAAKPLSPGADVGLCYSGLFTR